MEAGHHIDDGESHQGRYGPYEQYVISRVPRETLSAQAGPMAGLSVSPPKWEIQWGYIIS